VEMNPCITEAKEHAGETVQEQDLAPSTRSHQESDIRPIMFPYRIPIDGDGLFEIISFPDRHPVCGIALTIPISGDKIRDCTDGEEY